MLMAHHQNARKNHNIKITNRSFENVAQFKYLGTTATDQNLFQEEIKMRLHSGNACYHSAQKLLSSHLLSKNVKILHDLSISSSLYNQNTGLKFMIRVPHFYVLSLQNHYAVYLHIPP
jgi:hypothetical protein